MIGKFFLHHLIIGAFKFIITTSGCYFFFKTFHTDSMFSKTPQDHSSIKFYIDFIGTAITLKTPCWININKGAFDGVLCRCLLLFDDAIHTLFKTETNRYFASIQSNAASVKAYCTTSRGGRIVGGDNLFYLVLMTFCCWYCTCTIINDNPKCEIERMVRSQYLSKIN